MDSWVLLSVCQKMKEIVAQLINCKNMVIVQKQLKISQKTNYMHHVKISMLLIYIFNNYYTIRKSSLILINIPATANSAAAILEVLCTSSF